MNIAAVIAAARAAVAKTYPSSTDLILAEAEAYGQRRLYPVTAAADAVAALVGAKTIEPRHLPICGRLGLSVVIVPASALAADAPAALRSARLARDAEKIAEATAGARAAIHAIAEAAPDHQVGSAWQEDGGRLAVRNARRAYAAAKAAGTLPAPKPPQDIPEIGGEPMPR